MHVYRSQTCPCNIAPLQIDPSKRSLVLRQSADHSTIAAAQSPLLEYSHLCGTGCFGGSGQFESSCRTGRRFFSWGMRSNTGREPAMSSPRSSGARQTVQNSTYDFSVRQTFSFWRLRKAAKIANDVCCDSFGTSGLLSRDGL